MNAATLAANSRGCDESLYEDHGRRVCASGGHVRAGAQTGASESTILTTVEEGMAAISTQPSAQTTQPPEALC